MVLSMNDELELTQHRFAAMLLAEEISVPDPLFVGDTELLAERAGIYRGNLHAIWSNSLRNAFPVIEQLVGSEFFEQLAILYGQEFPSSSGDLNLFGQYFSDFLRKESSVKAYPYFSAVAQLEWQVHRAYYSADAENLDMQHFLSTCGPAATEFALRLHPAASLFQSDCAAVQVYAAHLDQALDAEESSIEFVLEAASFALVTRPDWIVKLTAITQAEFVVLSLLQQGQTLAAALDAGLDLDKNFDVAATLTKFFAAGAFSDFYKADM